MSRLERARALLARPGGWVEATAHAYLVRHTPDRRVRPRLSLDEAGFRALVEDPGLKLRDGGGWVARRGPPDPAAAPVFGRPGFIEGERPVMTPEGRMGMVRANLGESPLAWLARRKDPHGRPLLSPAEVAAGERLRMEAEVALSGPSLTMRWDALPRAGGGSAARVEPGDRALTASRRLEVALAACGAARPMVEAICVRGSALQVAERELGMRRRTGRTALAAGLRALAAHYRIG